MIQCRQVTPVMDQRIAHPEGCPSDITRAMDPVWVRGGGRRRSNVGMNVGTVGMLDHAPIEGVRTLVHPYHGLRMYTEMQTIEFVDGLADTFNHRFHETTQSIGLISALNFPDSAVFYRQMNRLGQIGGYADVP